MAHNNQEFTIGVEEDYQIVNPLTRELRSRAERILPGAQDSIGEAAQPELFLSQIEIATPICRTLADVRAELVRLRRGGIQAAKKEDCRIASAGTHPFSHWEGQQITPKERHVGIAEDYQQLAREQLIFGCHVHVGISDREAAIQVMNRVRQWLAPLLELASSSPFWLGVDTGYASFRTEVWRRWPFSGTPLVLESRGEYDELIDVLIRTGSITDATKIYWDVCPSARFETLEFRITDVCLIVGEAVMVAGLCRALARACYAGVVKDEFTRHPRPELLRAAKWRAARFGIESDLIDIPGSQVRPAAEVIENLLAFLRPSLEENNEWDELSALVRETVARGTGASRQREVFRRTNSLEAVVDFIIAETEQGTK